MITELQMLCSLFRLALALLSLNLGCAGQTHVVTAQSDQSGAAAGTLCEGLLVLIAPKQLGQLHSTQCMDLVGQ